MRQEVMALAVLVAGMAPGGALAEDVPVETGKIGKSTVTLHVQPFLNEQELTTLRLVLTNKQALEIFLGQGEGFAAMAVNPD